MKNLKFVVDTELTRWKQEKQWMPVQILFIQSLRQMVHKYGLDGSGFGEKNEHMPR